MVISGGGFEDQATLSFWGKEASATLEEATCERPVIVLGGEKVHMLKLLLHLKNDHLFCICVFYLFLLLFGTLSFCISHDIETLVCFW